MKIKGIKKAVTEINNNNNLYNRIMFDQTNNKIFVEYHADSNSYCEYYDENIAYIGNWEYRQKARNIKMTDINKMIEKWNQESDIREYYR